jgi:copper(I)-binding protein
MKRTLVSIALGLLIGACGAERGIEVHEAWTRPAAQGENGAIYFVINNYSARADELIGVSTDVADAAEIHESRMNGDVMQMNQLESVPLEASQELVFEPGGLHVMLVDVNRDLQPGDQIEIVLEFRSFEHIRVIVPVSETAVPEENHNSEDH